MRNGNTDCAQLGGCPSDYVAVGITAVSAFVIVCGTCFFIRIRELPQFRLKQLRLLVLQSMASITFLLAILMSRSVIRINDRKSWKSCYIWQVWLEGPLGYGLMMSCHVVRVYRHYHLFVRRHLPPLRSYQILLLLLVPWCAASIAIQIKRPPMTYKCRLQTSWTALLCMLHVSYVPLLLFGAWTIREIEFKFQEFQDLLKGVLICLTFLAMWTAIYIGSTFEKEKKTWLQAGSRFILILMGNAFVLSFLWIPVSRPLLGQLNKRIDSEVYESVGQVLQVPHSGCLATPEIPLDMTQPLESLLTHKRFRQSFLSFAESRIAGEFVHFYNEVHELNKIPSSDTARRVYMAEHIIGMYIKVGAPMEINISHQMRHDILITEDLAGLNLFNLAICEAIRVMKLNLMNDYLQSAFFRQFQEIYSQDNLQRNQYDGWVYDLETSTSRSLIHEYDDPFDEGLQDQHNGRTG
eukprot:c27440_g1_i1 orf=895-2289(-)